ncbi:tryptophanase [Elusimicrobiota bacterium]
MIHTIEYVGMAGRKERDRAIKKAGYNTFLLMSKDVMIDLLTDSGTSAMSVEQWHKYNGGVETQASSKDYFEFVETAQNLTGYKYIVPTHQGRAAEHIMSQIMIENGFVPGNMYFTTTKLHQEMAGGTFVDVITDEAHDPTSRFEWKGNINLTKLDDLVKKHGSNNFPYISFEMSVNMAGGQPFSMDNARKLYDYCRKHEIPVMFDSTRAAENAYMIKKRDPSYHNVSIKEILKEMFSYGDGCTWSSKKDPLVNIGGMLAFRSDENLYKKSLEMLRKHEGTVTSGGMSAGDMAAQAQGLREMANENYIRSRVEQTQYLGKKLIDAGIPIVEPPGSHAIFLDAKRFLPHLDQDEFPAQALSAAIFVECGVRAMERGNVSKGRDPKTGENYRPALELVRLTIPRRAYTNSHMDTVAQGIISVYHRRKLIKGLRFTYEPKVLRFFQGKFEETSRKADKKKTTQKKKTGILQVSH